MRLAIQSRQESVRTLALRYGVSPTTIQKWRKHSHVHDVAVGPKQVQSSPLTLDEEAAVVAFRRHTLLPLDDCLYALQPSVPHPTRSSLHRCLKRHGILRLPEFEGDKPGRRKFKVYPIGSLHLDIAEVRIQFYHPPRYQSGPTARFSMHLFERLCRQHKIEHRLTKPNHPWTNGQVERMNRTIKDATVKRYHYGDHQQLIAHLELFVAAYNHARRLKTLKGLTPYQYLCRTWTEEPERFKVNPYHHTPGLNT